MPVARIATVGFDLDMTLVATAAGIVDTQHAVLAARGVTLDGKVLVAEVGVPVEGGGTGREVVRLLASRLRRRRRCGRLPRATLRRGLAGVVAMPGAADALANLRRRGALVLHTIIRRLNELRDTT